MHLLGRRLALSELPGKLGRFVVTCAGIVREFESPLPVVAHYVRSTLPPDQTLTLRNGLTLGLSGHKHDLITAVIIFCRREYGDMDPGSTVIDIGANIGMFSLYAASQGARRVLAFEPSGQAHAQLARNISQNDLQGTITAFHLAVAQRSHDTVRVPMSASPYNAISTSAALARNRAYEEVATISLEDILTDNGLDHVDLLKLDCEGAEYEILPAAPPTVWARIDRVRMEYHQGPVAALVELLQGHGFRVVRHEAQQARCGILWLSRATAKTAAARR